MSRRLLPALAAARRLRDAGRSAARRRAAASRAPARHRDGDPGGRLPRHARGRPVPLAGGRQQRADGRVGGGAERRDAERSCPRCPQREELRSRLTELWNVPRLSGPRRAGPHYAWSRNDGLQPQDVMLLGDKPADGGSVLLDPERVERRRHRRAGRHDLQRRRRARRVRGLRRRLRLAHPARARRRQRHGHRRRAALAQVHAARVEPGRQRLLVLALSRSPTPGQELSAAQPRHGGALPPAGRRRSRPTASCTPTRRTRSWNFSTDVSDDGRWLVLLHLARLGQQAPAPRAPAVRARRRAVVDASTTPGTSTSSGWATTATCSTCAPTGTRRAAASSPSTSRSPSAPRWREVVPETQGHAASRPACSGTRWC